MKHVVGMIALQMIAFSAMASTEGQIYAVQPQVQNASSCAQVAQVLVINKEASLDGDTLVIQLADASVLQASFTYKTTTCLSDIVCITSNNFAGQVDASVERNNDGEYPTHDLPGYKRMSLLSLKGDKATSCDYDLK